MFPTVGDAQKYCEEFGLKRVRFDVVFETAEALHRAFVAGQEAAQHNAQPPDPIYDEWNTPEEDEAWEDL